MTRQEENIPGSKRYSFSKKEKLCSTKVIKELFNKGSSFSLYPFRIIYLTSEQPHNQPLQMLCSVPKRNFKRAVDRNLIKRRCKEAYRLNKDILQSTNSGTDFILYVKEMAIIYTAKEIIPYNFIEKKLSLALQRLANTCQGNT
jgi:ribonuclease P protein component